MAEAARPGQGPKNSNGIDPHRANAFVDLVHALINANEFTYRF